MIFARWLKFSVVGGLGLTIQLAALWVMTRAGMPVAIATALAVELAILHNFVWHEAWTWKGGELGTRWNRLLRFHAATGVISIVSNVALTLVFKAWMPLLIANVAAVGATAILNFLAADLWVFRAMRITRVSAAPGAVARTE